MRAAALVAAAGGFEANLDWLKEHWGAAADNFIIRGTPYNSGTVLRMLLDHGVEPVGDPTQCHAVAIDARAPKFDGGIVTRLDCVVFGIVVNKHAQRFYDEGEDIWPKRYAIWGRLIAAAARPDRLLVFDAKSLTLFMPSLYPPMRAGTIRELAAMLALDPERSRRRSTRSTPRCGPARSTTRRSTTAAPRASTRRSRTGRCAIDTAPFYAYPLRPGITFTYLGTRVDREARMRMQGGGAATNMFAAGEIMAGNVLGRGYVAGIGMTIGSVFGRVAGRGAAAHVRH